MSVALLNYIVHKLTVNIHIMIIGLILTIIDRLK